MDHWGDPWADNANDKSPTKNTVTSRLPPSFTFAPVPLNGFVDDAGWGNNDDDGFGDWATSDTAKAASTDVESTATGDADPGSAGWGTVAYEEKEDDSAKWPEFASSLLPDLKEVDSEPSDSSTVSQLDEAVDQDAVEEPTQPQIDAESSVRSSTSPSEASRHELPTESPRTSIEDERANRKDAPSPEPLAIAEDSHTSVTDSGVGLTTQSEEPKGDESKAFEGLVEQATEMGAMDDTYLESSDAHSASNVAEDLNTVPEDPLATKTARPHTQLKTFVCDEALLTQLFPLNGDTDKQLDEHDDPIFSTSARKAWYRRLCPQMTERRLGFCRRRCIPVERSPSPRTGT